MFRKNYNHFAQYFELCFTTVLIGLIFISFTGFKPDLKKDDGWQRVPEILKNIVPPDFPDRDFVITKYGAVADGKTICNRSN